MKNLIILLFLVFMISCTNVNNNESKTNTEIVSKNNNYPDNKTSIDSLLKGVWFEIYGDVATFKLDGKYVIYPDSDNEPITYVVKGDSLIINGNPIARCKILKITKDSLWFTSEFSSDTTRLFTYKR